MEDNNEEREKDSDMSSSRDSSDEEESSGHHGNSIMSAFASYYGIQTEDSHEDVTRNPEAYIDSAKFNVEAFVKVNLLGLRNMAIHVELIETIDRNKLRGPIEKGYTFGSRNQSKNSFMVISNVT